MQIDLRTCKSCRSCKKSHKSLSRNVLVFNKSMASPVENVSLLPRRGVKCEQAAGPTGGQAQAPVVWILCGRVWGLPTLQVPVEKPHPYYSVARAYSCAYTHSEAPFCVRGCQTWCPDCVPFAPTGNTQLSLASGERIFRSPIRISDALLICQHLFLPTKAVAALLYPTTCHPNANHSFGARVWAWLMSRQPLAAISAQSGRNPPPTPLHPSPQPLPDLRLPDTLPHTCFPF